MPKITSLPKPRAAADSLSPWGEGWGQGVFKHSKRYDAEHYRV